MNYRILLIQLAALTLLYVLLHNDCMAILKACTKGSPPKPCDDHINEEEKAIADAIFGSIGAPLFARTPHAMNRAHVEEVPDENEDKGPNADSKESHKESHKEDPNKPNKPNKHIEPVEPIASPGAASSLNTAGSAVKRRPSKRSNAIADLDVSST